VYNVDNIHILNYVNPYKYQAPTYLQWKETWNTVWKSCRFFKLFSCGFST